MRIGILDDEKIWRQHIKECCMQYLNGNAVEFECVEFTSGEEVIEYCNNVENDRIDLLFLDIEMPGLDGIQVKNAVQHMDIIYRIVFVTNYDSFVRDAFGFKVIGFLSKPSDVTSVGKEIENVLRDLEINVLLPVEGLEGVYLEDLRYITSKGNYVYFYLKNKSEPVVLTMQIGEVEKKLEGLPVVRVHKSHMVNLMAISSFEKNNVSVDSVESIPVGRKYMPVVKELYHDYLFRSTH